MENDLPQISVAFKHPLADCFGVITAILEAAKHWAATGQIYCAVSTFKLKCVSVVFTARVCLFDRYLINVFCWETLSVKRKICAKSLIVNVFILDTKGEQVITP